MADAPVITGVGPISAVGLGPQETWDAFTNGRSGIQRIEGFDASGFSTPAGGEVRDFKPANFVPKSYRKATKVMARDSALAVAAAKLAVEQAGLLTRADEGVTSGETPATYELTRVGCLIGAGLISADTVELATALTGSIEPTSDDLADLDLEHWGDQGIGNLTPLWMLKYLPNMLACHVTIIHGTRGPSNTLVCGEASGLLSMGEAVRVLERGAADAVLAGGVESKLNPLGLARMTSWGRLAGEADDSTPWASVRPFDPKSPGGLMGEGGAIVVVESAARAAERGAKALAKITGHGSAQTAPLTLSLESARHRSQPPTNPAAGGPNVGIIDAVERALADAGLTPADIDLIVPQATGVPAMDTAERLALEAVFGPKLAEIPLAPVTPFVGDLIAGAGAFQAAVAVEAIRSQTLPARLHHGAPDASVLAGASESQPATIRHAVVCTSSIGGQCAAVVLSTPDA